MLLCIGLSLSSCLKDEYDGLPFANAVTDGYVPVEDASSVRLSGRIEGVDGSLSEATYPNLNFGFVFSRDINNTEPEIGTAGTELFDNFDNLTQPFEVIVRDLESSRPYYFRAFIQLGERTSYGNPAEIRLDENFLINLSDNFPDFNDQVQFSAGTVIRTFTEELTDHGFVFSATSQVPEVGQDSTLSLGPTDEDGVFTALSGPLGLNTTYYVRAYAELNNQIIYTPAKSFTTTDGWKKIAILDNVVVFDATGSSTGNAAFMGLGCVDRSCPEGLTDAPWWEFVPGEATGTWSPQPDLPDFRRGDAVSFTMNDKLYYGLGRVSGNGVFIAELFSDIWEYDPAAMTWTEMDAFPGGARYDAVAFALEGKAYVGTGLNSDQERLKDIWIFDPAAPSGSQWEPEPLQLPGRGRNGAVAFALQGKAYIGTGENVDGPLNDIIEFDPDTRQWAPQLSPDPDARPEDDILEKRTEAVAFSANDKAYFGLGIGDFSTGLLYDFWEFDPSRGSGPAAWQRVKDFPQALTYPDIIRPEFPIEPKFGFELNGRLFIGGPNEDFISTDIWEYVPEK